eukprot:jgi/Psemu1/299908/fgenesh1_kg.3_\
MNGPGGRRRFTSLLVSLLEVVGRGGPVHSRLLPTTSVLLTLCRDVPCQEPVVLAGSTQRGVAIGVRKFDGSYCAMPNKTGGSLMPIRNDFRRPPTQMLGASFAAAPLLLLKGRSSRC